ncbi:hypothetical protein [Streptomyces boncukensis]|uniref:Uncharacterized protein n=1 Tax=Streptomyces boncukensis TaxID=2711219 RepID=A0A6G4X6L4_9ACTN|nr:hypothetical protein [Streptomyces boncukensis]NGO73179.1 hypothetical protein [Streptomyces boncukensis]
MTAHWPPADLPGLHVCFGEWDRNTGRWLHYPTADYRCAACGWTTSASGDAVPRIPLAITAHQLICPTDRKETAA